MQWQVQTWRLGLAWVDLLGNSHMIHGKAFPGHLRKHSTNIWESLWNLTWFQLSFVTDINASHFIKDFYLFILLTGITRFDLLGDFGRFNWLGNFYIVLSYNLLFAIVTTLCLVRKFTSAVREELFKALGNLEVYGHFFLLIMTLTFEFLFNF